MLVLLATTLMTATFITQDKIEVNLPVATTPAKRKNEDMLNPIAISKRRRAGKPVRAPEN